MPLHDTAFSPQSSALGTVGGLAPMSPRLSSPAHGADGADKQGGRGRGFTRRDRELIGQTVRIRQGPFKGKC